MRFRETAVGAGFVVAGALIVGATLSYPPGEPGQPGPALFPRLVGGLMMGFGALLARQGARAAGGAEPTAWRRRLTSPGFRNALFVIGAVLFYILVAERLGFLLTAAAILFGLMWRLAVRPAVAGAVAVAFSLFVWALFSQVLRVPLPRGGLGW